MAFAGDSISRHLYAALLRLVGEPGQEVLLRHQDFNHTIQVGPASLNSTSGDANSSAPGSSLRASFYWRPYPANLTQLLGQWGAAGGGAAPTAAVLTPALWHLLHVSNASDYGQQMQQLGAAARTVAGSAAGAGQGPGPGRRRRLGQQQQQGNGNSTTSRATWLVMTSVTETFPNRMPTEIKRQRMRPEVVDEYNRHLLPAAGPQDSGSGRGGRRKRAVQAAGESGALPLLVPAGPFLLLDLFTLTYGCGEQCSIDGVHSTPELYDAGLQLLLNIWALHSGGRRQLAEEQPGQ